jgi:drug/metabolite transporter (DMT)-like permease
VCAGQGERFAEQFGTGGYPLTEIETTRPAQPDRLTLAAFLVMVGLAGGNAVGIDILAHDLDPFWAAAVRFAAAGAIFAALMLALRVPLPRGAAMGGAMLYGAVGFGAAFGIAFVAILLTGAGAGQLFLDPFHSA